MARKSRSYASCELPVPARREPRDTGDRLYRHRGDYRWQGIRVEPYKPDGTGWAAMVRQGLIGHRGEATRFHLRYFEIAPGGYSTYETHRHEHVVVCIRGKGKVRLGKQVREMAFLDVLYIAPRTPHQLYNPFEEPFGFFCIVNARRDRPRPLADRPRSNRTQGGRS